MRYNAIVENDIVDSDDGISVGFYFQGCHFRCPGCHNQGTWDFDGGIEVDNKEMVETVKNLLHKNGIDRNLSILGGEPLAPQNIKDCEELILSLKKDAKKIYLWTGYTLEQLRKRKEANTILENIDVLIEGRFILEKRDLTLKLRGSSNQRIFRNINGELTQDLS